MGNKKRENIICFFFFSDFYPQCFILGMKTYSTNYSSFPDEDDELHVKFCVDTDWFFSTHIAIIEIGTKFDLSSPEIHTSGQKVKPKNMMWVVYYLLAPWNHFPTNCGFLGAQKWSVKKGYTSAMLRWCCCCFCCWCMLQASCLEMRNTYSIFKSYRFFKKKSNIYL